MTDIDKKDGSGTLQSEDTKTEAVKKEDAAPKPKKKAPGMKGPWMYVGPTVPGIGIQNRVYTAIPAISTHTPSWGVTTQQLPVVRAHEFLLTRPRGA